MHSLLVILWTCISPLVVVIYSTLLLSSLVIFGFCNKIKPLGEINQFPDHAHMTLSYVPVTMHMQSWIILWYVLSLITIFGMVLT